MKNAVNDGVPPSRVEEIIKTLVCVKSAILTLSGQAKWYFNGTFPVYRNPAVGHKAPDPKAMQELVDAGFVFFMENCHFGAAWFLTPRGLAEKTKNYSSLVY